MKSFTIFASLSLIVVISIVGPSTSQVYGGNPAYKIEILPEQISSEDNVSEEGGDGDRFARMPKRPPYEPLKYAASSKSKLAAFSLRGQKRPAASSSNTTKTTTTTTAPTTTTTITATPPTTTTTTTTPPATSTTSTTTTLVPTTTPAAANVTSEVQNR